MDLPDVDRRILDELRRDARLSMRELAARVGVSTPTASAKVKALEAMGLIRGYRAVLDASMLPRAGHVLVVETEPGEGAALAEALATLAGVEDVLLTEGERLFARHAGPADALVAALARLAGVRGYKLHPIVDAREPAAPGPAAPTLSLKLTCHECGGPIQGSGVHKRWPQDGEREHWFCCRNCATQFGAKLSRFAR